MNLRCDRLGTYALFPHQTIRDEEGGTSDGYGRKQLIRAEMWAAGGRVQQEMYGAKLPQVRNMRLSGNYREVTEGAKTCYHVTDGSAEYDISVNDGISLNDPDGNIPEYRVTAMYPYRFLQIEVERI